MAEAAVAALQVVTLTGLAKLQEELDMDILHLLNKVIQGDLGGWAHQVAAQVAAVALADQVG